MMKERESRLQEVVVSSRLAGSTEDLENNCSLRVFEIYVIHHSNTVEKYLRIREK